MVMGDQKNGVGGAGDGVARSEARVRDLLLAPLAGLARAKGETVAEHEAAQARLKRRLSYMSETMLRGLAELVLRQGRGCWPKEAVILSWAYGLQPPPPARSDFVASILRSAMGAAARDGGYVVELMREARRLGPPPGKWMLSKIREDAAANAVILRELRRQAAAGEVLRQSDQLWLDRYHADQETAVTIMDDASAEDAA